jgi:hypothetical protein
VDREELERRLDADFDGDDDALPVVSRQARDLADSGRIERDLGEELTLADVVGHLEDAPDDHDLVERWNWWVGSLEMSYGGYQHFRVRPDVVE